MTPIYPNRNRPGGVRPRFARELESAPGVSVKRSALFGLAGAGCLTLSAAMGQTASPSAPIDPTHYRDLRWRLVGPFRGGWGTCAVGVPDQPDTFYFGAAGGGVWKTTDAGATWAPIFEHAVRVARSARSRSRRRIRTSSTSAPVRSSRATTSRPATVSTNPATAARPGTRRARGDAPHRRDPGRSAQRRRRAGRGASATSSARIRSAACSAAPTAAKTWKKTLFVDETPAPSTSRPTRRPATSSSRRAGRRATIRGCPTSSPRSDRAAASSSRPTAARPGRASAERPAPSRIGRIGLAVAPGGRMSARVYAAIRTEWPARRSPAASIAPTMAARTGNGSTTREPSAHRLHEPPHRRSEQSRHGLHRPASRSDDSTDGGKTLHDLQGRARRRRLSLSLDQSQAPESHDHRERSGHGRHRRRRRDAGATGTTSRPASSTTSPPTTAFRTGSTPASRTAARSASRAAATTARSPSATGIRSAATSATTTSPIPSDPDIVYGSRSRRPISRWDARTGEVQNVSPWPVSRTAQRPTDVKYRYTWISPIAFSRDAPYALYAGTQVLFRSLRPRRELGDDQPGPLRRREPGTTRCDGDVPRRERPRLRLRRHLHDRAVAARQRRDLDRHRRRPDPADPRRRQELEGRHAEGRCRPGASRLARPVGARTGHRVRRGRQSPAGRLPPHVFRTHDYGKTWTKIASGPSGRRTSSTSCAPIPCGAGLLYAGTDGGVFVSFDDGERWQPLQLNLPPCLGARPARPRRRPDRRDPGPRDLGARRRDAAASGREGLLGVRRRAHRARRRRPRAVRPEPRHAAAARTSRSRRTRPAAPCSTTSSRSRRAPCAWRS